MKYLLISYCLFFACSTKSYSQKKKNESKEKIFITAGYGLAGSFFVRSYEEFAPISGAQIFEKKKFVGVAQNIAFGINLNKGYQLRVGMNFQHFTRRIKTTDTLSNVMIYLNHTIHHRDYIWFASISKTFEHKKHIFAPGLGIYYLRPKQEEVHIFTRAFVNVERDYHNSRLEEGGIFAEFAYEYKFQPKVNLGIKTQFYFTASAGTAESITLIPYIKISF
jgi:hypothetical protein